MDAASRPELGPNERAARIVFHFGLFGILLPGAAVPAMWAAAGLANWRREPGEGRAWGWACLVLALVDTLVAAALALALAGAVETPELGAPPPDGPRIGVLMEPDGGPGALVREVTPDSPAARAGLAPGDRIVAVDGRPLAAPDELARRLSERGAGVERWLKVDSASGERELAIVPEARAASGERALFEPLPGEGAPEASPGPEALFTLLPSTLVFLLIWLWARRRAPHGGRIALWLAAIFLAGWAGSLALTFATVAVTGGWSGGALLVGILGNSAALLAVGLAAKRSLERCGAIPPTREPAPLGVAKLTGASLLYLLAIWPRAGAIALLLGGLLAALGGELPMIDPITLVQSLGIPPSGIVLLVFTAVVLAPLSEELIFRGILLPWLRGAMGGVAAVCWSSVLFGLVHPHYAAFVLVPIGYGLVLGWARLRSGGLLVPILVHALINAVASFRLWWPLV